MRKELVEKVKEIIEDLCYPSISSFVHESIRVRLQEIDTKQSSPKESINNQQSEQENFANYQLIRSNTDITSKVLEL